MTKRAFQKFKRNKRDLYDTPKEAVLPLIPHLPFEGTYHEPCVGNGWLVEHLSELKPGLACVATSDISQRQDARTIRSTVADMFITNPPWDRPVLHEIIENLASIKPTWLLFDADWMHTKQAARHLFDCDKIVSVGRVSWMGNGISGFDNCAWYLFTPTQTFPPTFYGRGTYGR